MLKLWFRILFKYNRAILDLNFEIVPRPRSTDVAWYVAFWNAKTLAVAGDVFDCVFFVPSLFQRDVLDEIWDLIESVSEGFPTYFFI